MQVTMEGKITYSMQGRCQEDLGGHQTLGKKSEMYHKRSNSIEIGVEEREKYTVPKAVQISIQRLFGNMALQLSMLCNKVSYMHYECM
jgi:hypothetical protein